MLYCAAVRFADLQDGKHLYEAGDKFPREGLAVSATRLAELSGNKNSMGYPLIVAKPEQSNEDSSENRDQATGARRPRRRVKKDD